MKSPPPQGTEHQSPGTPHGSLTLALWGNAASGEEDIRHDSMNWTDVQYFLAVATGGSLPAGARDLGTSQVTAWRRLKRLEATLKVRLFEERKSGYIVSPAGYQLLEVARRLDAELLAVTRSMAGEDEDVSGEVRVTAPEVIASCEPVLNFVFEA